MQFTQWESMSNTISSKKIKLVKTGNNCLKTEKAGKYAFIIFLLFFFIPLILVLIITDNVSEFGLKNFLGFSVFVVIFGFGISFIQKFGFKSSVFDFDKRICYFNDNQALSFSEIKGIQILTYHHPGSGQGNRIRFEINLVKLNGERLHLYNNSDYKLLLNQAEILSERMGVELWDATNDY